MGQTSQPMMALAADAGLAQAYAFGPFQFSIPERSLRRNGTPVSLGARAFDILVVLVEQAGQVVRHDELITRVWTTSGSVLEPFAVHLTVLRKASDCRPDRTRYIANIPGKGYTFVVPATRIGAT